MCIYTYIYILMDLSRRHGGKANKVWFWTGTRCKGQEFLPLDRMPGRKIWACCVFSPSLRHPFQHVGLTSCYIETLTLRKKETKPGTTNKPGLKKWNTKENHTFSDVLHQQIPTSSTSRRGVIVFANPKKIENSLPLFTSYFPGVQFFYLFGE